MDALTFEVIATVQGAAGMFHVVRTPAGARSPRGAGKYHPKRTEIEFYDARYDHDPRFAPLGQFVSSYLPETLAGHVGGLDLMGYEPSWKVTAEGMATICEMLK